MQAVLLQLRPALVEASTNVQAAANRGCAGVGVVLGAAAGGARRNPEDLPTVAETC